MDGELKLFADPRRNVGILLTSTLIGLIFPVSTYFYFQLNDTSLDIVAGLLLLASLIVGIQMLMRIAVSIANLVTRSPRLVFTSTDVRYNLPFIKSFSVPLGQIEVIYRFIGYQQVGPIFSERANLVFILKDKSHSSRTKAIKVLDYFANLATPTGSSRISKKPENDYVPVSNVFFGGQTADIIKKLNAWGFMRTDPSYPTTSVGLE